MSYGKINLVRNVSYIYTLVRKDYLSGRVPTEQEQEQEQGTVTGTGTGTGTGTRNRNRTRNWNRNRNKKQEPAEWSRNRAR